MAVRGNAGVAPTEEVGHRPLPPLSLIRGGEGCPRGPTSFTSTLAAAEGRVLAYFEEESGAACDEVVRFVWTLGKANHRAG